MTFRHRLTLTPALSFVQARASNNVGTFPFSAWTFVPALSAVWDVTGDGKNVLRASASVYADIDLTNVARFAIGDPNGVSLRCQYNPVSGQYDTNCTYAGGASNSTVGKLGIPRTWEATLGGSRELQERSRLGTGLCLPQVHEPVRGLRDQPHLERLRDRVARHRQRPGVNDAGPGNVGRAQRRWMGATVSLIKTEGNLLVESSYTLSRLDGTVLDGFSNYYGTIPGQDQVSEWAARRRPPARGQADRLLANQTVAVVGDPLHVLFGNTAKAPVLQ